MLCQKCNQNEANVSINLLLDGKSPKELHMCGECHKNFNPRDMISSALGGANIDGFPALDDLVSSVMNSLTSGNEESSVKTKTKKPKAKRGGFLDQMAVNLNDRAIDGKIPSLIGRKKELEEAIETLSCLQKNNPVLIGEPGVGKTAIAYGLAAEIVKGNVPEHMLDKEVYLLDVADLVAGTGIRGQFETKMKNLITEVIERGNVILFIDEMHTIVGAGGGEGALDASNILKPALANGDFQIMGATTLNEYRKIEKDGALERRFQPIIVNEPSEEETFEILKGIIERYENHHGVVYSDDVLRACISLSSRYMQERKHPDKAISLLDTSGSKVSIRSNKKPSRDTLVELEKVREKKEKTILEENYEKAAQLRDTELKLSSKYEEQKTAEEQMPRAERPHVSVEDIQLIIEQKSGIPVRKIQSEEQSKMKNLSENLANKVIGQAEAVDKVSKAIRRARAGLKPKNRPIASFMFIGPTGVGKTELSKQLAEEMFGSKDSMIRLDMSEYMEKHTVSKLIGSPPGYIGHDQAGGLTEQVRRKPYSIILLDEIEKAHPDVQHIFLQILEDGRLTDSHGKTVSFKDCVIIATSNAGATEKKSVSVGFNQNASEAIKETSIMESLKPYFRPEFLNRFDSIINFKQLDEESIVKIVDLLLVDVEKALVEQGVTLKVTPDAKKKLGKLGYNPAFGARPLRRTIQEYVEDKVADLLLDEEGVTSVEVRIKNGEISVEKA